MPVLVGTVMLELVSSPNQPHRAEVQKLLVHPSARRRGLARALMLRAEQEARQGGAHAADARHQGSRCGGEPVSRDGLARGRPHSRLCTERRPDAVRHELLLETPLIPLINVDACGPA